ncbi:MAG TPA: hypothetical protein VFU14_20200 [Acidimicrobiales bacterium]|nr:hypothetical protein [Acidimicrobiales bacterium]
MAIDWDPTTGRVGLDVPVVRKGGQRLDHSSKAVGILVPSTAAETVTGVQVYFDRVADSPTVALDVYDTADTGVGAEVTTAFAPNEDVTFSATGGTFAGSPTNTAGNRYQNVDESSPSDGDYLTWTTTGGAGFREATFAFRVGSSGGLGSGAQIVKAMRIRYRVGVTAGSAEMVLLSVYVTVSGVDYLVRQRGVSTGDAVTTHEETIEVNPATGAAWTEAEAQSFDSTASVKLVVRQSGSVSGTLDFRIYWASVEFDHIDDPRLATAEVTLSAAGWEPFTFGSSWSKADATDYMLVLRRTSAAGVAVVPTLDTGEAAPFGHATMLPTLSPAGGLEALGDELTPFAPVRFTVGGVDGVDSQPYVDLRLVDVDSGQTISQEITRPSTATVGWLGGIVAASQRHTAPPSAPLLAKVRNSGGDQQGGTATFGPELVAVAPSTLRVLDAAMASAVSLANATQFDVELSSTAEPGEGWRVGVLDTAGGSASRGFGGATDRAEVDGVESDDLDVMVVQGTVPAAPTGLAATADVAGVGAVDLAWNATALGGSFARYEVLRLDPDGSTWRTVAHIGTEATVAYSDEACRRGVAETYAVQVRHTNGTVSARSSTASATCTLDGDFLVVPGRPDLSRAVMLHNPVGWEFPRHREEIPAGGFTAVTEAASDRGLTITGTVDLDGAAAGIATQVQWFRDLKDADVADVVLVTGRGERWIVSPSIEGGQALTDEMHEAPFRAVETSDVPTPVEVP